MLLAAKLVVASVGLTASAAGLTHHQQHEAHLAHLAHISGQSQTQSHGRAAIITTGNIAANGQASIPGTVPDGFSYYGLERLWVMGGGNPAEEGVAACIAEHESGGRTYATGAAGERGLWQIIPGWGDLSTYDPVGNAHGAVVISHNGSNWGPWTTRHSCGV
jgi:hypothetical protein